MTELLGVLVGAVIALLGVRLTSTLMLREQNRREEIKDKMKEIDTLILLNKKINEILYQRNIEIADAPQVNDYEKLTNIDDVKILIDDFIYLQSFCAQNHYYLPSYLVDEFFKKMAHRKIVLEAHNTPIDPAYSYRDGRIILEEFSDQLIQTTEDRKIALKKLTQQV